MRITLVPSNKVTDMKQKMQRTFEGTIVSAAMQKTLVVEVTRVTMHPKYGKRYAHSRRYKVHYNDGAYRVGDKIQFVECRPISKDKRWRVVESPQNHKNPKTQKQVIT